MFPALVSTRWADKKGVFSASSGHNNGKTCDLYNLMTVYRLDARYCSSSLFARWQHKIRAFIFVRKLDAQ